MQASIFDFDVITGPSLSRDGGERLLGSAGPSAHPTALSPGEQPPTERFGDAAADSRPGRKSGGQP
jgi:hypothetical protein